MITICAWCESKGKETILKPENNVDEGIVSHGICGECKDEMNEQFKRRYVGYAEKG